MPLTEKLVADNRVYNTSRSYDAGNRPISQTFADGKVYQWNYDARNLVTSASYDGEPTLSQTFDAGYRLTSQTFGNDLVRQITYGRQDNLRTSDNVLGKPSLNMAYSYAVDKQITGETIAGGVMQDASYTAGYDNGNRLTSWTRSGLIAPDSPKSQTWDIDDAGNWNATTSTVGNQTKTQNRTHNNADQITGLSVNSANSAVQNDLRGNLTQYEVANITTEIEYDLDNRMVTIERDGDDIELRYDALGRRVIRKEGTTKTAYIWWGDQEVSEHKHQAGQSTIQNDLWAHPSALNTIYARAWEGDKNEIQYYHKNYLDHVYAVSDEDGDILEHYRYGAYGEPEIYTPDGTKLATSAIENNILWNSRRYDPAVNFYYYKYRWYIPELGRWGSRDPYKEEGGINLYCFVRNNAFNRWDALGLHEVTTKGGTRVPHDHKRNVPLTEAQKKQARDALKKIGIIVGEFDETRNCHNYTLNRDKKNTWINDFGARVILANDYENITGKAQRGETQAAQHFFCKIF